MPSPTVLYIDVLRMVSMSKPLPSSSGHCNTAAAILQLKRASVCLPRLQLASHVSTPKTPMIKNFNKITIYIAVCGLIVKIQLNKIFPKNVQ